MTPKSNNLMQKERSKAISLLVAMETEDCLRKGAIMVVVKKIGLACADLLYHKTNNNILLLSTPTVFYYTIMSWALLILQNFFMQKNSRRRVMYSLVSLYF